MCIFATYKIPIISNESTASTRGYILKPRNVTVERPILTYFKLGKLWIIKVFPSNERIDLLVFSFEGRKYKILLQRIIGPISRTYILSFKINSVYRSFFSSYFYCSTRGPYFAKYSRFHCLEHALLSKLTKDSTQERILEVFLRELDTTL